MARMKSFAQMYVWQSEIDSKNVVAMCTACQLHLSTPLSCFVTFFSVYEILILTVAVRASGSNTTILIILIKSLREEFHIEVLK